SLIQLNQELKTAIARIETQPNAMEKGTLPSQPVPNPRNTHFLRDSNPSELHHEQAKTIITSRSRKEVYNKINTGG
ncbi:hypothetical protein PJI17_32575, partial [Mycobacterium kansasii]